MRVLRYVFCSWFCFFLVFFRSKAPGHDAVGNDRICAAAPCVPYVSKGPFCLLVASYGQSIPPTSNGMGHCWLFCIITCLLCSLHMDMCGQGGLWTLKMIPSPVRPNSCGAPKDREAPVTLPATL